MVEAKPKRELAKYCMIHMVVKADAVSCTKFLGKKKRIKINGVEVPVSYSKPQEFDAAVGDMIGGKLNINITVME